METEKLRMRRALKMLDLFLKVVEHSNKS